MSVYHTFTVRVIGPDDSASETQHFVASEDDALDWMAIYAGLPSYRDWQAAHPDWNVVVDIKDER